MQISEVLLFNTKSQRLKSLDIVPDRRFTNGGPRSDRQSLNSCSILVDSRKGVIDLFSLVLFNDRTAFPGEHANTRYLEVIHLRVAFTGEHAPIESSLNVLDEDEHVRTFHLTMAPPVPTGYRGQYRIQVGETPLLGGLPVRLKFDILFDADLTDKRQQDHEDEAFFNLRENEPTRYEVAESPYRCDRIADTVNAQWKGLAIQTTDQPNNDWLEYYSLMNDTFLVSLEVSAAQIQHSRIRAFCFDPKAELHGGNTTGFWEDKEMQPGQRWRERRIERDR